MSLNEYKLSKTQRDEALKAIFQAKSSSSQAVPKQHNLAKNLAMFQETLYGEAPANFEEKLSEGISEQEEEEYEVEHIVEKKVKHGKVYYKVKWRGWPIEQSTWEPEENLEHAPLKIKDFESRCLSGTTEINELRSNMNQTNFEPNSQTRNFDSNTPLQSNIRETIASNKPFLLNSASEVEAVAKRNPEDDKGKKKENKNKKPTEKKLVMNESKIHQDPLKIKMQEATKSTEVNLREDEPKINIYNSKGDTEHYRHKLVVKEGNGPYPHEKIQTIYPGREEPIVKLRKLNSNSREQNLLRSEVDNYMTSPTSLGSSDKTQKKILCYEEEKMERIENLHKKLPLQSSSPALTTLPMKDAFKNYNDEEPFHLYQQMFNSSNKIQTEISQIQNAYQRMVTGNHETRRPEDFARSISPLEAPRDQGFSLAKLMENERLIENSETDEPNILKAEKRDKFSSSNTTQRSITKLKKKGQGEFGSFEKGDIPLKVIGIRPIPEINDLEIMIDWKARQNGTKPYNSKVRRVELLRYGHFMPLIEFYESKMKLETAPSFDPKLLPKY